MTPGEVRTLARAIADVCPRLTSGHGDGATIEAFDLAILLYVDTFDWCRVGMIAEGLGMAQSSTSNHVQDLIWRGLILRERNRADHRKFRLTLTAKAKRLLRTAKTPPTTEEPHAEAD